MSSPLIVQDLVAALQRRYGKCEPFGRSRLFKFSSATLCKFLDFESIETQVDRLQAIQIDKGVRVSGLLEGEEFSLPDHYIYPSGV